jgi:hypothetical protein
MCGLCGIVGEEAHWTDDAPAAPTVPDGPARRRTRAARITALRRVLQPLGLTVDDWQAHAYLVATRTGRQEIADSIPHLWQAAGRLRGRACDPLDPRLIAALEGARDG